MSEDYGYINARIRGMKGRLLKKTDYEGLLATESLDDAISFLGNTPYGKEIELALTLKKGISGVDEGLRRNLENNFSIILKMSSERPRELLNILMGHWELFNIKTVLRGKHINATLEVILSNLIPFGRLDDIALRELAIQKNIKGVIDLLYQWRIPYATSLRKAFLLYREKEELQILEHALDQAYFETATTLLDQKEMNDAMVLEIIRHEIDIINISYAVKIVHYGLTEKDLENIFIPGGREIRISKFEQMISAGNLDELIKEIGVQCYIDCLESAMNKYLEHRRLSNLERALETCFIRNTCKAILKDPLSIGLLIGYLWLKANEVVNLRIITRGITTTMPREEIEKNLVIV